MGAALHERRTSRPPHGARACSCPAARIRSAAAALCQVDAPVARPPSRTSSGRPAAAGAGDGPRSPSSPERSRDLMSITVQRTLHVVSPLMHGDDVLEVQRRLDELGYSPGELDGTFGVAAESAVRAFQADHGLEVDGVAGPMTLAALETAEPGDTEPATPSPCGLAALEEAIKHIGTKESPPGSNRTPFGEWYGIDGLK